jgi:2',3'-cyclic-nucleotide 2'-phosphodiesterase (5'-nucleotidase family)
MGYVASAVGRSDLAFGRAVFERNVQRSRVPHVAEGWAQGRAPQGVSIAPSVRLQREGLELEILGLSSTSPAAADAEKLFSYLNDWAQSLQHRGVDAGIVVSDRCLSELTPAVERGGRTWPYLLLVIGQACGESKVPSPIYSIAMLPAGEGLTSYGRAKLTFDRGSHALLQATTGSVDITASAPMPDPRLQASLAVWTARHANSQAPQPSAADAER